MKEKYLKEDQDLLNELESIGEYTTGFELEKQKRILQEIQIKATLRHRKSFNDSEKSNMYFSKVLGVFALIQIIIAILQFTLQAIDTKYAYLGLFLIVLLGVFVYMVIKLVDKNLLK